MTAENPMRASHLIFPRLKPTVTRILTITVGLGESDTGPKYSGSVALVGQAAIQQPQLIQNPSLILHDDGKCAPLCRA